MHHVFALPGFDFITAVPVIIVSAGCGQVGTQIERGERKPSADLVVKIARLFEVSTDQLMLDELELDS